MELVDPAWVVLLRNLRLFGAGTSLCCGKQWVMIIKRKSSCIVLSRATCLQEPLCSKRATLDSTFLLCANDFLCLYFLIFLCHESAQSLSRLLEEVLSNVLWACSWVSLPGFCQHPFTSNKHTVDVKQNKVRRKAVNNPKLLFLFSPGDF